MYKPGMTQQNSQYSIMDIPQFNQSYDRPADSYRLPDDAVKEPMFSKDTAQAIQSGAQAGGMSGALVSGGVASGNPYALAGGLILSQIEAAQKAKAQAEAQRVADEKSRMANTQSMYEKMANQTYGV